MLSTCLSLVVVMVSGLAPRIQAFDSPHDIPATVYELHERQSSHWQESWVKKDRTSSGVLLPMRIGLIQQNLDAGKQRLVQISDFRSPDYGKHLSAEEVVEMFAPSQAAVETVKFWLTGAGLPADNITLSANKQWIQFDAEADMACELFKTEFFEYEHLGSGTKMIAVDEYSLPRHVRPHVDYITPGIKLRAHPGNGKATRRRQSPQTPSKRDFKAQNTGPHLSVKADIAADSIPSLNLTACDEYLTAACIRAQYNIPNNTLSSPGNELGVFEGLDEHYSREDLDAFFAGLHPYIPQGTYPISRLIDGAIGAVEDVPGYNQSDAGTEADADLEVAWPLIWPQKTVLFQTDDEFYEVNQTSADTPYLGFWNTFFDAIDGSYCTYSAYNETGDCTTPDCLDPVYPDPGPGGYQGNLQCGVYQPTNVISISYTGGEADLPASYVKRQCDEIMKLALQGVTVVQSSGDTGVASYPHLGMDNGCAGPNNTVFYPSADVTCPYVLAVGANQLNQLEANNASETTFYESSTDYSGGGFSNYFAAPEWQKSAITEYFEKVDLNFTGYQEAGTNFSDVGSGVYNLNGRGYPDVSAVGENYVFFRHGGWGLASGTSISAPIWAAVLTLVNELRLAANKSTVGFVHPVLYAHPEVFLDVEQGSNPGCSTSGFVATKGWDPVSGLGSPNFPELVKLFLSL